MFKDNESKHNTRLSNTYLAVELFCRKSREEDILKKEVFYTGQSEGWAQFSSVTSQLH